MPAERVPPVPGETGGPDGVRASPVLAVRPVAAVPVGELAAAAPEQLPRLQGGAVLVPQPEVGLV